MKVFDIESDGLLDGITKVHCICVQDTESKAKHLFTDHVYYQNLDGSPSSEKIERDGDLAKGLRMLAKADRIGGHNIVGYDIPALQIVYPEWSTKATPVDSKIMSQVLYPDLKDRDFKARRKGNLPESFFKKGMAGKHAMEAWGVRFGGEKKADFKPGNYINPKTGKPHTWATMVFNRDMGDYCMQDVVTNVDIIGRMQAKDPSERALHIENEIARIITLQTRNGVRFDTAAGESLCERLMVERQDLLEQAQAVFAPFLWRKQTKAFVPKRDNKKLGYKKGCALTQLKVVDFNPNSEQHIVHCLRVKYGWEPSEFTSKGNPKMDEDVLSAIPFPEARVIERYKMINKRVSQLAEGKEGLLKKVTNGRIYGKVNPMGCVTSRMSHYGPNLAQVPANDAEYGSDFRRLFIAEEDRVMVGADADALELRVLGHFMAKYDGGAYIEVILNGNKEDGTDIHTRNQKAIGLTKRPTAKTFFYAMLYGSGNFNLGTIVISEWSTERTLKFYEKFPPGDKRQKQIARIGSKARGNLMKALPALKKLTDACKKVATTRGYMVGLDGRHIPVRSAHAALNTLCQSAGALVMKQAQVRLWETIDAQGYDVHQLLTVHDEWQLDTTKEQAHEVGQAAVAAIEQAGRDFNFRCPLTGNYDVGASWAETH